MQVVQLNRMQLQYGQQLLMAKASSADSSSSSSCWPAAAARVPSKPDAMVAYTVADNTKVA